MTVSELIERLQKMPPHAPVAFVVLMRATHERNAYALAQSLVTVVLWEGNHVELE